MQVYKNTTSPKEKERENVWIHVLWKGIFVILVYGCAHIYCTYFKGKWIRIKAYRGWFTSRCINNQNHCKEQRTTSIAGCLLIQVCWARKKAHFQSHITINKHFGNQSNTYNNKYYNTLDYLHVWFIGCMCFYNKAPFHFKYIRTEHCPGDSLKPQLVE